MLTELVCLLMFTFLLTACSWLQLWQAEVVDGANSPFFSTVCLHDLFHILFPQILVLPHLWFMSSVAKFLKFCLNERVDPSDL